MAEYRIIDCDKDIVKGIILSGAETAKFVLSDFKKTKMYNPESELSSIRVCTFLFDKGAGVMEIRWNHENNGTELMVGSNGELHKGVHIPEPIPDCAAEISDIICRFYKEIGFSCLEANEIGK